MLVADSYQEAATATIWARRVGVDRVAAYLSGGMTAWATEGQTLDHVQLISVESLQERIAAGTPLVLVDVRAPLEFADGHIEGAINIPAPTLRTRYGELDPDKPTYLICSTGNRSSLAASILKQHGFREVCNIAGGMTAYSTAGYAKDCRVCVNPHGPRFADMAR
jgi:hydroxyacylglutathione hydrolase